MDGNDDRRRPEHAGPAPARGRSSAFVPLALAATAVAVMAFRQPLAGSEPPSHAAGAAPPVAEEVASLPEYGTVERLLRSDVVTLLSELDLPESARAALAGPNARERVAEATRHAREKLRDLLAIHGEVANELARELVESDRLAELTEERAGAHVPLLTPAGPGRLYYDDHPLLADLWTDMRRIPGELRLELLAGLETDSAASSR